ncbi:MAG: hypothetical protein GWN62_12440, partial [Aliifodinibius sp.]|nr:hypothetical protein [Nitrosopumilaceae archaeon]NIV12042.1 hypothetical protein [Fodinibius sp.]NIX62293.1 hypothetical protein [Nitrosopumilaceae archaeon]
LAQPTVVNETLGIGGAAFADQVLTEMIIQEDQIVKPIEESVADVFAGTFLA